MLVLTAEWNFPFIS